MATTKATIMLVEDDMNLAYVTKDNLENKGYSVQHCTDGVSCFELFMKEKFDLCLLDVMLPKMDGIMLAEKIREKDKQVPIIFVTAKSMLEDKIAGFKVGGDDYITKPFSIDELLFKIEVFLKRSKVFVATDSTQQFFTIGKYTFDFANLTLKINGNESTLTLREAEVLRFLALHQNELVPRENLLKQIWGSDDYFLGRSLDVFISRLRKNLKDDSKVSIDNIHSVGFKLVVK
ncbi:MAG: response regulator transcription factor [Chitinophagaceae bacterium]|nr:response regulator transcription factor [Chitinophagaceae bacterium]